MKFLIEKNIKHEIRLLDRISLFLGLNSHSTKTGRLKTCLKQLYSFVLLGVLLYQIFVCIKRLYRLAMKGDLIVQVTADILQLSSVSVTSMVCVLVNMCTHKLKKDILDKMVEIDWMLINAGIKVNYKKSNVNKILLRTCGIIVLYIASDYKSFSLTFKKKVQFILLSFYFPTFIILAEVVRYIVYLEFVEHRLEIINKKIKCSLENQVQHMWNTQEFTRSRNINRTYLAEVYNSLNDNFGCKRRFPRVNAAQMLTNQQFLHLLILIHNETRKLSRFINSQFSLEMLFVVCVIFMMLTCKFYYLIYLLMRINLWCVYSRHWLLVYCVSWAAFCIVGLISILNCTESVQREIKKTICKVHDLLILCDSRQELEHFSLQLVYDSDVIFTAYNFFNLDYSLLFTILGGTATYLVILIQFQLNNKAPCNDMIP